MQLAFTQFLQHLGISKDLFLCSSHLFFFNLYTQAEFDFTTHGVHVCMCIPEVSVYKH